MDLGAPNTRPYLAKRVRLQTDPVSGNPVLLHHETVIVLNQPGYEILRLCDGTHTLQEIVQELETQYPAAKSILSQDVLQNIKAISQKELIEWI
jgi:pyrroloquinoline quinone biosynthesis protein D